MHSLPPAALGWHPSPCLSLSPPPSPPLALPTSRPACSLHALPQAQYTDGKLTLEGVGSEAGVVQPDIFVGAAHYSGEGRAAALPSPHSMPSLPAACIMASADAWRACA